MFGSVNMRTRKQHVPAEPRPPLLPINIEQQAARAAVLRDPTTPALGRQIGRSWPLPGMTDVLRSAGAHGSSLAQNAVEHLQRQFGNRYVQRVVGLSRAEANESSTV